MFIYKCKETLEKVKKKQPYFEEKYKLYAKQNAKV